MKTVHATCPECWREFANPNLSKSGNGYCGRCGSRLTIRTIWYRPERFPRGFQFDPYMGDELGALRCSSGGWKIADEIDEGTAHGIAWGLVEPELLSNAQNVEICKEGGES